MYTNNIQAWQHDHIFLGKKHERHERRTWLVVWLTVAMMVAEIIGGTVWGSMALVADGWHMSTHALALGIAALAYRFARIYAKDSRLSFGTGKFGELAGFSSALILAMIALFIGYESVTRLVNPVDIGFSQAIPIAVVGLLVNLASAWLLHDDDHHHHNDEARGHAHGDGHHHEHGHHHHHDTNHRAAYVHVLADALTSVLAIVALLAGRYFGLAWLDPVMGLVGTVVILAWSWTLVKSAGAVLLDAVPSANMVSNIRGRLERDGDEVADLHLWRLGPGHMAAIISIVSDQPQAPDSYKSRLSGIHGLSHVTVEVQECPDRQPAQAA